MSKIFSFFGFPGKNFSDSGIRIPLHGDKSIIIVSLYRRFWPFSFTPSLIIKFQVVTRGREKREKIDLRTWLVPYLIPKDTILFVKQPEQLNNSCNCYEDVVIEFSFPLCSIKTGALFRPKNPKWYQNLQSTPCFRVSCIPVPRQPDLYSKFIKMYT